MTLAVALAALSAIASLGTECAKAVEDGKLDAVEAEQLIEHARSDIEAVLGKPISVIAVEHAVVEVLETLRELFEADPAKLRARAAELGPESKHAQRLLAHAARVEARHAKLVTLDGPPAAA